MKKKSLKNIYLMKSTYAFAGSFITIFIPIYFLSRGISLANVILFYLIYSLGTLVFFFLANKLVKLIGLRNTAILSYPFLFLYYFLVYNITKYSIPIWVIALVNSIQASFFWFPLHIWITNISTKNKMGNELGKFFAFPKILKIFSPVIAGFIIILLNFKALFILATILYLFSLVPLLFLPEFPYQDSFNLKKFWELFFSYRKYFLAEVVENLREEAEGVIYPIFVFLSFGSILSIGYIGTLGTIGSVIFILLVGKYADKVSQRKMMMGGAIILIVVWLVRFFSLNPIIFYSTTLMVGFVEALILIPLNSVVYKKAKIEGGAEFILFREFPVAIGRVSLYGMALMLVWNIHLIFILIALAMTYFTYLATKNIELKKE